MASQPIKIGAALAFAQQTLGGPLVENDSNPTIGATIGSIAQGNGDRVALIIVNLGIQDLFVSIDANVSSTNGIKVSASGGSVTMEVLEDYTLPSRQWWGIAPGGNTNVFVLELVRFSLAPTGSTR